MLTDQGMGALTSKALRVHIGTHLKRGAKRTKGVLELSQEERALVDTFVAWGWKAERLLGATGPCRTKAEYLSTKWGPVCMQDGALSFSNPRVHRRRGCG